MGRALVDPLGAFLRLTLAAISDFFPLASIISATHTQRFAGALPALPDASPRAMLLGRNAGGQSLS